MTTIPFRKIFFSKELSTSMRWLVFLKSIVVHSNCKFFMRIFTLHAFCILFNILGSLAFIRHLVKAFVDQACVINSVGPGSAVNTDMILLQIIGL